jgi:hypothetical protein
MNAGARNLGIEVIDGRAICATLSLAIEAKHRSIAAIVAVLCSRFGPATAQPFRIGCCCPVNHHAQKDQIRAGNFDAPSLPGILGAEKQNRASGLAGSCAYR